MQMNDAITQSQRICQHIYTVCFFNSQCPEIIIITKNTHLSKLAHQHMITPIIQYEIQHKTEGIQTIASPKHATSLRRIPLHRIPYLCHHPAPSDRTVNALLSINHFGSVAFIFALKINLVALIRLICARHVEFYITSKKHNIHHPTISRLYDQMTRTATEIISVNRMQR